MSQIVVNGISSGLTYALVALAVTLIFGLARVVHFAVADFAMATAFVMVAVAESTGSWTIGVLVATAVALGLSVVSDRAVFRFTARKPVMGFLASLGLILMIRALVGVIFGTDGKSPAPPFHGSFEIFGVLVRNQVLVNALVVAGAIAAVYGLLERTQFGLSLKAVADSKVGAALMGVRVTSMVSAAFIITGFLIVLIAWVMATAGSLETTTANAYLLKGFAAALIGGLGSIYGALVAGLVVGIVENLAVGYGPEGWTNIFIFGAVIAILLIRPEGLWQQGQVEEVQA